MILARCIGLGASILLVACVSEPGQSGAPHRQPVDSAEQQAVDAADLAALQQAVAAELADAPKVVPGRRYDLAELIDLAQRRNPATRQAWILAREAGRQRGVVASVLAPAVTLSAVAGRQEFDATRTLPISGTRPLPTTAEGAAAVLSVNWLLFDFGENRARQEAAQQLARVSELSFARVHQQLVYDVSLAYHARLAALSKAAYARQASARAGEVVAAADRRLAAGLGTEVEVAQARQLAAQTRLIQRAADGEAAAAAANLAALVAAPPGTRIALAPPDGRLPASIDARLENMIDQAFLRRTDVRAALAQVNAAEADLRATAASYLPRVVGGGFASAGNAGFDTNGVIPLGVDSTGSTGVFVGLTVPIFDGRLREARLRGAEDRVAGSRAGVQVAMLSASREIAIAYEGLQTTLALRDASAELVAAARTTYAATLEAYQGGIGTVPEVSAAALGLFGAQEASADAQRDAYQAAATLALAIGQ